MVVVGACITTRTRPLLARQFVEISKAKVEALLHAFVKLVEFSGSEHTYLETEAVRYVYQPVEGLYLVLVTTKNSNIFEDLSTLRMFVSIVQDTCSESASSSNLEEAVVSKAFDIVFMLDELISCGGHRESLTLQQIQSFVAMDSHEEKIQRMIAEGKEKEQKDRRREIALRLQRERQQAKQKAAGGPGLASSLISERQNFVSFSSPSSGANGLGQDEHPALSGLSSGGALPVTDGTSSSLRSETTRSQTAVTTGMRLKGMRAESSVSGLILQELLPDASGARPSTGSSSVGAAKLSDAEKILERPTDAEPLSVSVTETVKASLQTEGVVKEIEVQGTFSVVVNDPLKAALPQLKGAQLSPESDVRYKLRSHPIVDKAALVNSRILQIADGRSLTPHQAAHLLKWRIIDRDESLLPLSVSCWPASAPGGATSLSIEIEVADNRRTLRDVRLSLLCPPHANPQVVRSDAGSIEHDGVSIHWSIPVMGEELPSASIELVANAELSTLLPFSVEFFTESTSSDISVVECCQQEGGERLAFAFRRESSFLLTICA